MTTRDAAISHADKLLFPAEGITKGELAAYYEAVAPVLLPYLRGRPVTLERYPDGIDRTGFMQKNVLKGTPAWLERIEVPKKQGSVVHPLIGDVRSLLWLANQNCITPHVWTSRLPRLYQPDLCVFDLDPSTDDPEQLRAATLSVRDVLLELGLPSWVKTTGSKGFHLVVPLDAQAGFDIVSRFADDVGRLLCRRQPEVFTQEFSKVDRGDRILIDTGRNGYSATFAAAYAVRARPGAPVSTPCTWDEVASGAVGPRTFSLRTLPARLTAVGDLWAGLLRHRRSLRRPAERLQKLLR